MRLVEEMDKELQEASAARELTGLTDDIGRDLMKVTGNIEDALRNDPQFNFTGVKQALIAVRRKTRQLANSTEDSAGTAKRKGPAQTPPSGRPPKMGSYF